MMKFSENYRLFLVIDESSYDTAQTTRMQSFLGVLEKSVRREGN